MEDTVDAYHQDRLGYGLDHPYSRPHITTRDTNESRVVHYPRLRGRLATWLHLPAHCNCGATWRTCPDRPRR